MVVETEMQSQVELQGNHLRKQLAACVRSIQWSYAIFWSLSTRQEGLLEWNDGYYNGDIKTRKTTQPTECKADQMVLHRSEQLRELYESLSTDDSNQQNRRPSASLSPEDLTDAEWYYLICMSFTFMLGQETSHAARAYLRGFGAPTSHSECLTLMFGAPPPKDWLKANFDGSLSLNGIDGCVVVVRDCKGGLVEAKGIPTCHWDSSVWWSFKSSCLSRTSSCRCCPLALAW